MDGQGHLKQKPKPKPAGVRSRGPTRVKGLCLLTEKGSVAQPKWENLEVLGEELKSGLCSVDIGSHCPVLEQRWAMIFKRKQFPLCLETRC